MRFSRLNTNQSLFILILVSLAIKLVMAYVVPITGDEAYFIQWGEYPDYGYYDHTPMVGWWLAFMLEFGRSAVWLRLPNIVSTTVIGWLIYILVSKRDRQLGLLAAGLYLLTPGHLMFPWITTDTPLLLLSFLSGLAFYKAQERDGMGWYLLCGVLLGAAFFSKFFAGLLGIAYLTYVVLFTRRGIRPYLGILVILIGVAPFIAVNLVWNYYHCWDNYLFNLENRTKDYAIDWSNPLHYAISLVYLLTPPIVWYLFRHRREMGPLLRKDRMGVFLALYFVPILLFVPISLGKGIGLHWTLSFYPFIFIALALLLSHKQMKISLYFMAAFSALHLLAFAIVWTLSPGLFKNNPSIYKSVVFALHSQQLYDLATPYRHGAALASPSYAAAAIMDVQNGEHVLVIGAGSYHGRQDDMLTDYRDYDKKDIVIFSYNADVKDYARFFDSFRVVDLPYEGTHFYLGIGTGFKYAVYKQAILDPIRQRYYRIPSWLPRGECYMDAR